MKNTHTSANIAAHTLTLTHAHTHTRTYTHMHTNTPTHSLTLPNTLAQQGKYIKVFALH